MNGSIDREGVHGIINAFDLERARLLVLDRPDFYLQWNEQKKTPSRPWSTPPSYRD